MKPDISMYVGWFIPMLLLFFIMHSDLSFAQKGQNSDIILTYDFTSPESKTQIPFDKRLTLQVLHFITQKIDSIKVFQADFVQGTRTLKTDYVDKSNIAHSVYDFAIKDRDFKAKHDTLFLYLPPLKPNREFDIVVTRGLSGNNLDLAFKLNEAVYNRKPIDDQIDLFNKLKNGAMNIEFFISSFRVSSVSDYQNIFNANFRSYYNDSRNNTNFPSVAFLTMVDLNLMNAGFLQKKMKFAWGHIPVRLIKENELDDMFAGILPADYTSATKKSDYTDYKSRVSNLSKSIAIIDTIYRNLNTLLFKDDNNDFENMRSTLKKVIGQLVANRTYFNDRLTGLTDAIQSQKLLLETEVLVGNTNFKDIKTEGSNIFTLDIGIATVGGFNTKNRLTLLPKFYYGVNIYFRPIDKNTRREALPSKLTANPIMGPDYNIEAQKSVWQHLSLSIGLTTGSYSNKEFYNLYGNTSLLVGAGYRFYRALKVTAGIGFLRQTSKNPVITDTGVYVSPFVSFSADIDFVSTIKDIISPLWK